MLVANCEMLRRSNNRRSYYRGPLHTHRLFIKLQHGWLELDGRQSIYLDYLPKTHFTRFTRIRLRIREISCIVYCVRIFALYTVMHSTDTRLPEKDFFPLRDDPIA